MQVKPIGIIHTPYREARGTPIQTPAGKGVRGWVEVFDEFVPGLKDLCGFERIWLLYWFHRAARGKLNLHVTPFLDKKTHGLFATRAPLRPNLIGISAVRLLSIRRNRLGISDIDILNGTPLLDIKPYIPQFDCFQVSRCGWVRDSSPIAVLADERFAQTMPRTQKCTSGSKTKSTQTFRKGDRTR
jgi:tRNA-Thr(GGU) m(6)t(6)A37 methyltransferase TsaA